MRATNSPDIVVYQPPLLTSKRRNRNDFRTTALTRTKTPSPTRETIVTDHNLVGTRKQMTTTKKTKTKTKTIKYANHPDYEFDTLRTRWVKKSDLRPIPLVNSYKMYLKDYLKTHTNMDHKKIDLLVKKHATSENRLKEILVAEEAMTKQQADRFFTKNNFWNKYSSI